MFVLQDCTICYEGYDAHRPPHFIPCGTYFTYLVISSLFRLKVTLGHVFCHPCFDSLTASSPRCPQCRIPFSHTNIHKVICRVQDPPALSVKAVQEEETNLWQAISSSIESASEYEQRKWLVQNNPAQLYKRRDFQEYVYVMSLVLFFDIWYA